ncbi:hypothetical protein Pelo_16856 [Pelomyxa schiedti]|nr:hypothetical protein Pelo_16856 [Pelomyxa schiedti]
MASHRSVSHFDFKVHEEAEHLVRDVYVGDLARDFASFSALDGRMRRECCVCVYDVCDHIIVEDDAKGTAAASLASLGFEIECGAVPPREGDVVMWHPWAVFPRIVVRTSTRLEAACVAVAILVDDISSFLMANGISGASIEGSIFSSYRSCLGWKENHKEIWIVERRGWTGFKPIELPPSVNAQQVYLRQRELWAQRQRAFANNVEGMTKTIALAKEIVSALGSADSAAWLIFSVEREYWEQRNWAGKVQKGLQDRLGLGWSNHDHHTFRSSRNVFPLLIEFLKTLGFECRERFYAGAEAGWGAQVMIQKACRFAVFADVDLAPEEVEGDFTSTPLPARPTLGTVGLWCAIHGESALTSGLHHVAARVQFNDAVQRLTEYHLVKSMKPFSSFSYLYQTFTVGERWKIPADKLASLEQNHTISNTQASKFASDGAVGSHLELIQRGAGFAGFNQATVSDIISRTDPRAESH